MADDIPDAGGSAEERRLRARFRFVAGIVILGLLVVLVLVDAFGRLLVRPDFHIGIEIFAPLLGALLVLAGVEGLGRVGGIGGGK